MRNRWNKIFALIFLLVLFGVSLVGGEQVMADTILYRVGLTDNKNHVIVIKQSGENLSLSLEGFGSQPLELKATGGGTSTCRTIIEHTSAQATVSLSLPIADPRAPCRKLPGFISIESKTYKVSFDAGTSSTN